MKKKEKSVARANIEDIHTILKNDIGGAVPEPQGVTWEFIEESGALILSGSGETEDYAVCRGGRRTLRPRPWEEVREKIGFVQVNPGVTGLGNRVFAECPNLKIVMLSGGLERIGKSAFEECGELRFIIIPEGVTLIDDDAFRCCSSLMSIYLPNSVERVGDYAFAGCKKMWRICVPEKLWDIGECAFTEEALQEVI